MAQPTVALIRALRVTANRLDTGATYKWSHFANCNCGHLAQTVTNRDPREIYRAAFRKSGDWGEQALEYCSTTGMPMDMILNEMMQLGLTVHDFGRLERLSDARVLARVGRPLRQSVRQDAVDYMRAWADLLEEELAVLAANGAPVGVAAMRDRADEDAPVDLLEAAE